MIEIMKFELVNKGPLIARFTLKMMKWGGLQIRECTLFESGPKRWINLPSRQYQDSEGKTKYFPFLAYEERSMDDKFKEMIIKAVDEYMAKNLTERKEEPKGDFPF
jgi:hypothetical protein